MKASNTKPLVLIAEDSPEISETYALLLSQWKVEAIFCENAEDAYHSYQLLSDKICLVITDGQMLGESGIWLARQIRAHSQTLPIVLISGFVEKYHISECEPLFFRILEKPFKVEAFIQIIEETLALSCSPDEPAFAV